MREPESSVWKSQERQGVLDEGSAGDARRGKYSKKIKFNLMESSYHAPNQK